MIAGTFVRVPRPALWPWLAGGAALRGRRSAWRRSASAAVCRLRSARSCRRLRRARGGDRVRAARPPERRRRLAADRSRRRSCARARACRSLRLHGRRRAHAAGVVGAVAAAVTLASLPVFWHGVVISALPADARAPRLRARARLAVSRRRRSACCRSSTDEAARVARLRSCSHGDRLAAAARGDGSRRRSRPRASTSWSTSSRRARSRPASR